MTSFFGGIGNPFSTPVGQRIEQATDASLASENWALNMEICDLINELEDGPKDAIKALRKRLHQNAGKNYTVVMYALTVLETCVKNCGKRFHVYACSKEFIQELVKLIGPKNDPPTAVQEKVLSLIQCWADAFRHQPELAGVAQVYADLKQKGIEFPMTDLDTMAPIHTPQRSVPDGEPSLVVAPSSLGPQMVSVSPVPPASPAMMPAAAPVAAPGPAVLTSDQVGKLQSELDVVQGNMAVLSEMLSELKPGKEHPSDRELLHELHATCRAMQQRLVELIGKLANDELTAELLRVNDELNNLFLRYARFENNRESTGQPAGVGSASANDRAALAAGGGDSLIDLSDEATPQSVGAVASKLSGLAVAGVTATSQLSKISSVSAQQGAQKEKEDSDFDMFAQSRNVTYESSKTGGSTYQDNLPDQMGGALGAVAQSRSQPAAMHSESDFDEMAAWLEEAPAAGGAAPEESLTSSEFERFLAERAAAADALPTVPTNPPSRSHHHRQLNKEAEPESSLFAL